MPIKNGTRPPGAGRRAAGPNGEPRNHQVAVRFSDTEKAWIEQILAESGGAFGADGVRTLVLSIAAPRSTAA